MPPPATQDAPAQELPRVIAREALNELPLYRYEGSTTLVATHAELDAARAALADERVIGFDTETRPAFRKGESYLPCLAQVATARGVFLFRLDRGDLRAEVEALLATALGAAGPVKAGVSLADDLRALRGVFDFEPGRIVDLGVLAKRRGLGQTGVRNLAGIFLGVRVPKGPKTSNWAAARLTAQQIVYAATDAWICRELYLDFERRGFAA